MIIVVLRRTALTSPGLIWIKRDSKPGIILAKISTRRIDPQPKSLPPDKTGI
jgi:hypothetical protein